MTPAKCPLHEGGTPDGYCGVWVQERQPTSVGQTWACKVWCKTAGCALKVESDVSNDRENARSHAIFLWNYLCAAITSHVAAKTAAALIAAAEVVEKHEAGMNGEGR